MDALEKEKETLTLKLSDASITNEGIMAAGNRLAEVVQALESKSDRWLELSEFI